MTRFITPQRHRFSVHARFAASWKFARRCEDWDNDFTWVMGVLVICEAVCPLSPRRSH
jgi:hypothetical protein